MQTRRIFCTHKEFFYFCFRLKEVKKVYKHFKRKIISKDMERSLKLCAHLYVVDIASKTSSKAEGRKEKEEKIIFMPCSAVWLDKRAELFFLASLTMNLELFMKTNKNVLKGK